MGKKENSEPTNPFIAIPASLGGIFVGIVAIIALFARENMALLLPISWGFVVLGSFALFFAYMTAKNKKE